MRYETRAVRRGARCLRVEKGRGRLRGMSTLSALPTDPKELRPLLHAEIDRLPDEQLAAAHRVLQEMEIQRLMDELGAATEEAWASGQMTEEKIAEAIREHRARHPYR